MSNQAGELEDHHRKKMRSMLNPVSYNNEVNIEYAQLPKKSAETSANLQTSKMTAVSNQAASNTNSCSISLVMNHSNILRYL